MTMTKEPAAPAHEKLLPGSGGSEGPPPAASLTATMVRRGGNPWWGKDQPKATTPAGTDKTVPWQPPRPLRARALLEREERLEAAESSSIDTDMHEPEGRAPLRAALAATAERDGDSLFENLPTGLLRDIGIFIAVFAVSCAAMLYLSFGAS
jgi:hypothetical protein